MSKITMNAEAVLSIQKSLNQLAEDINNYQNTVKSFAPKDGDNTHDSAAYSQLGEFNNKLTECCQNLSLLVTNTSEYLAKLMKNYEEADKASAAK